MTPAGQTLAERAKAILSQVDEARAEVQNVATVLTGRLAIGISPTPGPLDVVELLKSFHARHPGIDLIVREGLSVALADELRADELDLAIISGIDEAARLGLELTLIAHEPLVAIVSPRHRFARLRTLNLAQAADETFILFPPGATIRTIFDRLAVESRFEPHRRFETQDTTRMRSLVAAGLGIGILPKSDATRPSGPSVVAVDLGNSVGDYELFLARRGRRPRSPAAAALTDIVTDLVASRAANN